MDPLSPFLDRYRGFLEDLGRAADDATVASRANQAYAEAAALLQDGWQTPAMLRVTEAFDTYRQTVADGFRTEDSRTRVHAAVRAYVESVRDAWRALPVESTGPSQLVAIADGIRSVAWLAYAAAGDTPGTTGTPGGAEAPDSSSIPDDATDGGETREAANDIGPPTAEPGSGTWGATSVLGQQPGSSEKR
jgi:hypothetical protein